MQVTKLSLMIDDVKSRKGSFIPNLNPGCGVEYGIRSLPDESSRHDAIRKLGCEDKYDDIKMAALEEWKRLSDMATICRRVPEHRASTFREAVQSFWFAHLVTCAEDGINANSLGQLDRIFEPYYGKDLA